MKYLVVLSFCIFALDIQACRRPALDNDTMCNKNPACKWTTNGCKNNFSLDTKSILDLGESTPLLGTEEF